MAEVVVIGRNYTSRLGMIRAVGRAGHQIVVISTRNKKEKDIDAYSKYVTKYLYAPEPNRELLIKLLLDIGKGYIIKRIIIPVDDYTASVCDQNIEMLKNYYFFPNIEMQPGRINALMDKGVQKELAIAAGFSVVKGWKIDIKNHQYVIPEDIKYPCYPKPQISFMGSKQCMKKCSDETQLREALNLVAVQRDIPILIEEYVVIEKEYGVLGFCDHGSSVTPGIVEKKLIGEGHHKGVTKVGVVSSLDNQPSLKEKITKFLSMTNLTGLCDIDLYESNSIIFFNELNLRFGAFGYSILCAGVNLPNMLIQTLLSEQYNMNALIYNNTTCVSEKVNFDDYLAGYYGFMEYRRINNMADFSFLNDKEDPQPYNKFKRYALKLVIKQKIIRIVNGIKRIIHKVILLRWI